MDIFKQLEKGKSTATGRKKIEIKQLDKYPNKQVTFSKRRAGLFKKASELCILCKAQVAIIVFSPADKAFCFGQPNAETIIARYLTGTADLEPAVLRGNSVSYEEHNKRYEEAKKVLDVEKKQLVEAGAMAKVCSRENWWKEPVDKINVEQLKQYTMAMLELRRNVAAREDQLMMRSFYGARPLVAAAAGNYSGFVNVNHFGDKMFGF